LDVMTPVHARRTPTVIVARRARPGREREFERWLRRLVDRAGHAPGFVASEIQPPDDTHPGEWVVVYRFVDAESLEAWMHSPARTHLLEDGNELVEPGAREQVVAVGDTGDPVTAVSSVRVKPDAFGEFRAVLHEVEDVLGRTEGFIRLELLEPVAGVQDDTIVFITFDDRARLDRWLASDERRRLLARMEPFTDSERVINVVGGFAGWFEGGMQVRRWKSAAAVLAALIPTSLLYAWVRQTWFPDIPLVPGVVVGNVFGILVLTWLLMPWITRRLDRWLRR
jgi:uncharacterized protein